MRLKHLGDSLVNCGIIKDDNPKIIKEFIPIQIKVKKKEEENLDLVSILEKENSD